MSRYISRKWATRASSLALALLLLSSCAHAKGLLGVFQGTVIRGPVRAKNARWLYVQSKNGMVRRVNIIKAEVDYDDDVPAKHRRKSPIESLHRSVQVRVTAEQ